MNGWTANGSNEPKSFGELDGDGVLEPDDDTEEERGIAVVCGSE